MKLPSLIVAGLLTAAAPAMAYPSDDWGFPIEYSTGSYSQSFGSFYRAATRSNRTTSRNCVYYTATGPSRTTVATTARSVPAQPTKAVATSTRVAPKPPAIVSARPSQTQRR